MSAEDFSTDEIRFSRLGRAGLATLSRPAALNALSHGMVKALAAQLAAWADDAAVEHVVIEGSGGKAFSAGGDIRRIYEMGMAKEPGQLDFFADEYRLNTLIKRYPKPYTALIDGIVMGGGVGLSVHGRYRVGTEKTLFAMPEVGIGFFPDVGGTAFLPRCPGGLGTYLAMTGARIGQADALAAGVLTHTVARDRLEDLKAALAEVADPAGVFDAFASNPGPASLAWHRKVIDHAFAAPSVAAILAALEGETGPSAAFAQEAAALIRSKSPTSVMIAFRQVRAGADLDFEACMRLEFRIVSRILQGHDFYEGVRAVLVDKDNKPAWQPASLSEVDPVDIDAHFVAPEGGDLEIPSPPGA